MPWSTSASTSRVGRASFRATATSAQASCSLATFPPASNKEASRSREAFVASRCEQMRLGLVLRRNCCCGRGHARAHGVRLWEAKVAKQRSDGRDSVQAQPDHTMVFSLRCDSSAWRWQTSQLWQRAADRDWRGPRALPTWPSAGPRLTFYARIVAADDCRWERFPADQRIEPNAESLGSWANRRRRSPTEVTPSGIRRFWFERKMSATLSQDARQKRTPRPPRLRDHFGREEGVRGKLCDLRDHRTHLNYGRGRHVSFS